jgi:hypothetical protein
MPGFDAYHKWMGIPPEDQPADHYRLLGLVRFESDRDVIDASVNKQMSYLRICAKGEHADQAEEILNRVSQARLCLLDDRQKRVYDARLRGSASAAPQTVTTDWSIETKTAPGADRPSREHAASASDSVPGRNRATASFSRSDTAVRQPDRKSRPFRRDWSDRLQTRLRQPFVWIPAVCLLAAVVTASLLSSPSSEAPSPGLADADGTVGDTTDRTDQTVIAAGSRHSTESSGAPPEPTVAPVVKAATEKVRVVGQDSGPVDQVPVANTGEPGLQSRFLAELQASNVKVAHRGWFSKEGKGTTLSVRNSQLLFGGTPSPHGIYMHPGRNSFSRVVFRLDRPYHSLKTAAAIPLLKDERRQGHPVTPLVFKVLGDGKFLWGSEPLRFRGDFETCEVSLTGVQTIELRVECPGADNWAVAAWFEPTLDF